MCRFSGLMAPSGFGGRGVLPGVATGTGLNPKSSRFSRLFINGELLSVTWGRERMDKSCSTHFKLFLRQKLLDEE